MNPNLDPSIYRQPKPISNILLIPLLVLSSWALTGSKPVDTYCKSEIDTSTDMRIGKVCYDPMGMTRLMSLTEDEIWNDNFEKAWELAQQNNTGNTVSVTFMSPHWGYSYCKVEKDKHKIGCDSLLLQKGKINNSDCNVQDIDMRPNFIPECED